MNYGGRDHCSGPLLPRTFSYHGYGFFVGNKCWFASKWNNNEGVIQEDNAGALVLAETLPPQFTPRSTYYAIKTVWFREEIHKRGIKLLKIDTVEQLGDIFMKGLPRATFEYLRKRIMGW